MEDLVNTGPQKKIKKTKKERNKEYYLKNKPKIMARRLERSDQIKNYQREYKQKNREKLKAYQKEYKRKNKDKLNAY